MEYYLTLSSTSHCLKCDCTNTWVELKRQGLTALHLFVIVPDHESRDRDVILVRRTIHLGKPQGVGKLEWGGNGEGMGRGRSVYEQPGAKVDG
jgi:hypothetical protein